MARGENPGALLSVDVVTSGNNALTYDKDQPYGHANAGKDLVLSLITSGNNAGKAQIGADNAKILGKFMELHPDGTASYMPSAMPMLLRKSSAAVRPGSGLLCAGSGKVKSEPSTATAESATNARGQVTEIQETGDNGRILALMP